MHGQMLTRAAQANHVFTHGAVTHLRLFKQELLEADNIEEVALLFAVEIATETAKRYPLFSLFKPGGFIHQRVEAGNRNLIHDFTATNQRDAVE